MYINYFQKETKLVKFACETKRKMSELRVNSLNITESDIILESSDIGTLRMFLGKGSDDVLEDDVVLEDNDASPTTIKIHKRPFLTSQSIAMAKNLHILLTNIKKLSNIHPLTMNPLKFESAESYNQFLLEKIKKNTKEFETEIENDSFVKISLFNESEREEVDDWKETVIPEIDLLKLDESFSQVKEETIKTLVSHLVIAYDTVVQEHIGVETKRRKHFRNYVNFLSIYRQIEVYCNLFKMRVKGETIKNQTNNKIFEYSLQKINQTDLSIIIKAAKRIERLINLSNYNWCIVDTLPNLDVNFFRSTSVSVAAFECWLKIVETGEIFSEKECQKIYLEKKEEENRLREDNLKKVYKSVLDGDEFDGDSPMYVLDDADSPRYYPEDPMDEDDKQI